VANVNFNIYNRLDSEVLPMTGFSLPFEVFKFIPNFNSVQNYISDKKVIWDFGDNTTSTNLTSYHSYTYPGTYPVTLTVFTSSGEGTQSTYLSTIKIANIINDVIILTTDNAPIQISGEKTNPIFVSRYNSHQTSISGRNTILTLSVSGNKAHYYTAEEYYKDKNSHFYSSARFVIKNDLGFTVVDEISTSNDNIYATPQGNTINLTLTAGGSSYLAGSSGSAVFYYVEDYTPTGLQLGGS